MIIRILLALSMVLLSACDRGPTPEDLFGGIVETAELATVSVVVDKLVYAKKQKRLFFWTFAGGTYGANSQAIVELGVDLSELDPDDILVSGDRVRVRLPAVEIVSFSYRPSTFKVDDRLTRRKAWFGGVSVEDIEGAHRVAELELRQTLAAANLQQLGEQHTRKWLTSFFRSRGFTRVQVSFGRGRLGLTEGADR